MALNSFQLFLSQVQTASEVLELHVPQVVFDVLMVHERRLFWPMQSVCVRRFHYFWLCPCELIQMYCVTNSAD